MRLPGRRLQPKFAIARPAVYECSVFVYSTRVGPGTSDRMVGLCAHDGHAHAVPVPMRLSTFIIASAGAMFADWHGVCDDAYLQVFSMRMQ